MFNPKGPKVGTRRFNAALNSVEEALKGLKLGPQKDRPFLWKEVSSSQELEVPFIQQMAPAKWGAHKEQGGQ